MKKIRLAVLFLLIPFLFQSCFYTNDDDGGNIPVFVNPYTPVILDRTTFENSVESQPAKPVTSSGKIYIKDNLMFVNETNQGFHVYNYTDPENPVKIGFIAVPGATDLAVRNGSIYINQAVDLVTLSYNENDNSIVVKSRNKNVFPQKTAPNGTSGNGTENQIIINWIPN